MDATHPNACGFVQMRWDTLGCFWAAAGWGQESKGRGKGTSPTSGAVNASVFDPVAGDFEALQSVNVSYAVGKHQVSAG